MVVTPGAALSARGAVATTSLALAPPEVYTARFVTVLTAPISSGLRPTTISVAATQAAFGAGTFSIAIYDAGTDTNPVNFEALEVTGGGASLNWGVTTEQGWAPLAHAAGSTVVATVLTPRSIQQPLTNHGTPLNSPDPHSIYLRKVSYANAGDLVVGLGGAGQFMTLGSGSNGQTLVADSTRPGGLRWAASGLSVLLQHMGDLIVGGLLGVMLRLGVGSIGQILTVGVGTPTVADPVVAPVCTPAGAGGSLVNGFLYDFAYSWVTSNPPPDGGETRLSPIGLATASPSGVIAVQCPSAPAPGLTLNVYAQVHATPPMSRVGTLVSASTSATNTVQVGGLSVGLSPPTVNTTGGLTPRWAVPATAGTVTSVGLSMPAGYQVYGSPVTGTGVISVLYQTQPPNTVFAAPVSGTGYPSFRSLVNADLPAGQISASLSAVASMTAVALVQAFPYINIQDQKPSGTHGGTFTSGAWQRRDLNTIAADTAGLVTLASNQFTLPSGIYRISASAPAYGVQLHQTRLQNITDSLTVLYGTSEMINSTDYGQTRSFITGRFTIGASKTFEIDHQCLVTRATAGFGNANTFGNIQIWTNVELWKEG
jgi:hypothetical protein